MQEVVILTKDEYKDLLKQKNEPDSLLRDTNLELKKQIEELKKQPVATADTTVNVDSPIIINDGVLHTTAISDFVQMYNTLTHYNNCATLKAADTAIFDYLEQMATMFACKPFFKDVKELKKYRTSLQSKGLYENVKRAGLIHLLKVTPTEVVG